MRPGPKLQPVASKRARAVFEPGRHGRFRDVEVPRDLPSEPDWLTDAGRQMWLDIVPRVSAARSAIELDSIALGTLANIAGACALAWRSGAVPPAAHLAELRRLSEVFGLCGHGSRVREVRTDDGPNPFAALARKSAGLPPS